MQWGVQVGLARPADKSVQKSTLSDRLATRPAMMSYAPLAPRRSKTERRPVQAKLEGVAATQVDQRSRW
jgi:hypothetical protein